jgi:hypothetical protein
VLLFAAVGVVLLIACVNVSQLLLARAIDRQKDRAARGAGASRSASPSADGGSGDDGGDRDAARLRLGRWALTGLAWLQPPSVPIPKEVPLDSAVLLFTGGVSVVVAMLCGLAPAMRSSRPDISRVLQAGFRRASGEGRRLRDGLAVVEMALSVALVAVSALLIQSLLAVQRCPWVSIPRTCSRCSSACRRANTPSRGDRAFFKSAIENVRTVPGVQSAALVRAVPFSGNGGTTGMPSKANRCPIPRRCRRRASTRHARLFQGDEDSAAEGARLHRSRRSADAARLRDQRDLREARRGRVRIRSASSSPRRKRRDRSP